MIDALVCKSPAEIGHPVRFTNSCGQAEDAARRSCALFIPPLFSYVPGTFPTPSPAHNSAHRSPRCAPWICRATCHIPSFFSRSSKLPRCYHFDKVGTVSTALWSCYCSRTPFFWPDSVLMYTYNQSLENKPCEAAR